MITEFIGLILYGGLILTPFTVPYLIAAIRAGIWEV